MAFLRQFIKTKAASFSTRDENPSENLIKTIRQAERDRKAGKASPIFSSGDEAVKWLNRKVDYISPRFLSILERINRRYSSALKKLAER